MWVGITQMDVKGVFRYDDGNILGANANEIWDIGHPRPSPDCAAINEDILLESVECGSNHHVVCQRELRGKHTVLYKCFIFWTPHPIL